MKKYMFLSIGFSKPTPDMMAAWQEWFGSMADRTVEQGGLWGGAREITENGTKELPLGPDSITGYLIFRAESLDEAEELVRACPVVLGNRVYEIMSK